MKKFSLFLAVLFSLGALFAFPWIDNIFKLVENGSEREIQRTIETDYSFKDHTRSSEKENLLMVALKNDRGNDIIDLILKQGGISPDSKTKSGVTSFMYACQYESDMDAVKNVLYTGASSDAKKAKRILAEDKNGLTSFDYARKNESKAQEILSLLSIFAVEPEKEAETEDESSKSGENEVSEDADLPPLEENTPLPPAEENEEPPSPSSEEIAEGEILATTEEKQLIDLTAVASPALIPESIYLYDYAANEIRSMEIPDSLIAAEEAERKFIADANSRDSSSRTKLMLAAKKGDISRIENLLYSGAEINAKDDEGWTALMYAARFQKNADVTSLLLYKGADRALKNKYGLSALVLASGYSENPEVISALLETYPANSDEARAALSYGISNFNKTEALQAFLDKGVPLNIPYDGKTPLMVACQTGKNTKIIEWLLKNGASKKLVEETTGKTAFDYAKENRKLPHNVIYWSLNPNS